MGDHAVKFERILDYKDKLLRTNSGTSCVVKLGEANEKSKPKFLSFYICFDALKKTWVHCKKCIGLDCCFLKRVCKGQLLVVVGKDSNNQMLPLALAVVEKKNINTWSWFVRCIKDDLGLREGEGLTLITDMQKGLFTAIEQVLPQSKHRRCARHILANWAKEWRDLCQCSSTTYKHGNVISFFKHCCCTTEITTLPGRPAKNKKKEVGKTKKSEKLPRTGLTMTCSLCYIRDHNKRGCPHREPSAEPTTPAVATATSSGRRREAANAAPQGKKDGSGRGRGRPKKTPPEAPNATPQGKSNGSGRERGRSKPGMPSSKIYSTGQAKVARSADVTGDIGYTSSSISKLKWNSKSAISTRKLQELKENKRKKKVGSSSNHRSQNTASSQSNMP
ncbi:putative ADP-ribosylation factor GTPase-activating protein AGD14-like [Capsicum annuum]|nr:putative ADP-ribosylation factor GTPase-activating protein AGD14-like [Capsicum annuum]KAF3672730.1 putative ADP-ribosylation factor GTPase-activating protein AGD14-like [Capsicum annuum]